MMIDSPLCNAGWLSAMPLLDGCDEVVDGVTVEGSFSSPPAPSLPLCLLAAAAQYYLHCNALTNATITTRTTTTYNNNDRCPRQQPQRQQHTTEASIAEEEARGG